MGAAGCAGRAERGADSSGGAGSGGLGLLYPPCELSVEQIQTAVLDVARYDVFKLGEAMLSGDVARLARMLDGLRGEGAAPVFILWALAEELRALWRIKQG